ncbi:hypothetical protein G6F50_017637 [Rhizopus delemar]|uniref:Uncharacterized protein n=1 Tax=Rhizopus delemar TaxID=936053 RepID=A0A9P7BZX6_9FUNG|nr:hypothetical protein G6F50_017637 [Rhizopus delemar]
MRRARSALDPRLGRLAGGRGPVGDVQAGGVRPSGRGLGRGAARAGPGWHHDGPGHAADSPGLGRLGAGRGMDRVASPIFAARAGRRAVPGCVPGEPAVSRPP